MLMVITSFPRWSKTQQVRLNTLVKFEPAEPLFGGQFSPGANKLLLLIVHVLPGYRLGAALII
jgi:hypothetical protein